MAQFKESNGSIHITDNNDFPRVVIGSDGSVTVRDSVGESAATLAAGGGSLSTVTDGTTTVSSVSELSFSGPTVTNSGAGVATVTYNTGQLAQSGQVPSQNPVSPGTANVGALNVAARADHVHPSYGLFGWLGDGSMGSATFDGTATPTGVVKDSATLYHATGNLYYTNMTINDGVTLNMAGFMLCVQGTLAGPSTGGAIISVVPNVATGTNQDTAASSAAKNAPRPVPLGPGRAGVSGGTGAGSAGTAAVTSTIVTNAAGAGGLGSGGAGGSGGTIPTINTGQGQAATTFMGRTFGFAPGYDTQLVGAPTAGFTGGPSGGAGGGDGTNKGGAGGAGGSTIIVNARVVTGIVNVTAPGGAGGSPTVGNCGGGGGGAGGIAYLNSCDLSGWTGAISAAGGAGGTAVGTGVNGSSGGAGIATSTAWL